jgi:N2-(2-carboxyethyl)arginine synthase
MRIAEQVLHCLASVGIQHVFGIVGREADSILFNEVPEVDFVLTRHEFSAGVIACGLSRFRNTPQACFSTLGPGSTNLATPLATAFLDRYPLVAISAQIESNELNYGWAHQCVDGASVLRPVTKFSHEVRDPREVPQLLGRAVAEAMAQPFGPAFISIPNDVLKSEAVGPTDIGWALETKATVGHGFENAIAAAGRALSTAERPLIVVGDAALRGGRGSAIQQLAERHEIAVITSYSGKGALPPQHSLHLGAITPHMDALLEHPALDSIFGPIDCILLLGYDLAEHLLPQLWQRGHKKTVIRAAEWSSTTPGALEPDVDIVGPLDKCLQGLQQAIMRSGPAHSTPDLLARLRCMAEERTDSPEGIQPHQVVGLLNERYPDYVLANDIGQHRHVSALFYRANRPLDFLTSAGLSSFGVGLPFGIGAKLAYPDRNVVVIAGDSGFHSNSGEMETVVRLGMKLLVLLFDNQKSALIERYQMMGHGRVNDKVVRFGRVDFARLAEANGWQGLEVARISQLPRALDMADAYSGPTLIQLPVHYPGWHLNRFARNIHVEAN